MHGAFPVLAIFRPFNCKPSIMKKLTFTLCLFVAAMGLAQAQSEADKEMIRKIYDEALYRGEAYENLRYLTKEIGARLSGSPQAAAAVEWGRQVMESYGFDTVYLQPVMVPHWVRGDVEQARIVSALQGTVEVNIIGLGNSIGTVPGGISAEVIEVTEFEELQAMDYADVEGKIVFFNRPFDDGLISQGAAYGGAVGQRGSGPVEAAKKGAIGCVVRSMTSNRDDVPHTGGTRYQLNVPQIPAVAISTNDADRLSNMLKKEPSLRFFVETSGKFLEDELSYNVIGELWGSEKPEEIMVVGGHLDSWDVGEGAHDDGAGTVHTIEVLRIFKAMDYRPKHTIRGVLFMNEENGLFGGRKYAEVAETKGENHLVAMESDSGGFVPRGFTMDGEEGQVEKFMGWASLFSPYQADDFGPGGGGADIGPLKNQGVPLIGFRPDGQRYFDFHHTAEDTFEKVDDRELHLGAAAMASLFYLIDQYGL